MSELIEGAYYRWHFKDEWLEKSNPYWCKTCIGIVKADGNLYDIFWHSDGYRVPLDKTDIEFISHADDIDSISERDSKDYDDKDIVYMRNPNAFSFGPYFLRKGSIKSKTKILDALRHELADAEYDLKSITRKRDNLLTKIKEQEQ